MAFYCAEGGSIPGISLFGFSATTAILAGASLLIEVFQRKYYLMVNSNKGIRKIAFEKSTALAEIEAFIGKAHDQFGYEIGRQDLNESGFSPGQI